MKFDQYVVQQNYFPICLKTRKPYQSCVFKLGIQKLVSYWPSPNGRPPPPPPNLRQEQLVESFWA